MDRVKANGFQNKTKSHKTLEKLLVPMTDGSGRAEGDD